MSTNNDAVSHRRAVIGHKKSFWLYDSTTGFDLTHPETPQSPAVVPNLTMNTTTSPVTVDPAKSALVIVDMQNYFLSPAFGRARGPGHDACDQLKHHAIPAARKSGTHVIWLNWGLTDEDIDAMPPGVTRAFGFEGMMEGKSVALDKYGDSRYKGGDRQLEDGKPTKKFSGLGSEGGMVPDPASGKDVDAGRLLMRDQWNSAIYTPLVDGYDGEKDAWVHKNRMSGLWGSGSALEKYLEKKGIRTLLFTGVNTDQCVGGTYQDAFSQGYDCILLADGCGTTSPNFAQHCIEYNAANTWGFVASCKDFADGAAKMKR